MAVKHMPVGSLIIGVDLAPIKPIRGVKTLLGDITTQKCRQAIRKEANGSLMDVVLHDGELPWSRLQGPRDLSSGDGLSETRLGRRPPLFHS